MKLRVLILFFISACFVNRLFTYAFAPTNFFRPYDINFRMAEWKGENFKLGTNVEYGHTRISKNWSENKASLLGLYNPTESALGMLMGMPSGSAAYNLANNLLPYLSPVTDDGNRGRFKLSGEFEGLDLTLWSKFKIPMTFIHGNFDLDCYLPFRYMRIGEVKWVDQTRNVLNADIIVHQMLTDNFKDLVLQLGGLDLNNWKKFGLGDLVIMLSWYNDYKQMKEHLRNVRLTVKVGLSAPSGSQKNEDKTFSLPLGNDGAWGIPLGAGIDLDFVHRIRAGLEFEMLYLFDQTKDRRMMTDEHQTDFLLLSKANATKSFGFTWKFNLFLQARHFCRGLSAMVAYQFMKHDDDKLTAQSNDFDYYIVNSAQSLQEWGVQNFVFQLNYDFFKECKNTALKPQLSLFYKLPVAGKRVFNTPTFGGQLAFNF